MKTNVKKVLVVLLILSMLPFQKSLNVQAKGVPKLNKTSLYLSTADTYQLKVLNTTKKVKWSSSNNDVVWVDSKGVVQPAWFGKAIITAKVDGITLKCTVNVLQEDVWYGKGKQLRSMGIDEYQVSIMRRTKSKARIKLLVFTKNKTIESGTMYGKISGNTIKLNNAGKYGITGTIKVHKIDGIEDYCGVNIKKSDAKIFKVSNIKLNEKLENS